jgi:hypothetical protein
MNEIWPPDLVVEAEHPSEAVLPAVPHGHCPGPKQPFWDVVRPARLGKSAIQNRFTVENASALGGPGR